MSKLVNCKACGKEIAKGVNKCPSCGKDQRNFFMKHKVITVILAIVIIGGIGSAIGGKKDSTSTTATNTEVKQETKQEVSKEEALNVSAVDLAAAYEDNEVNADKTYKDKNVEVVGKIDDIGVTLGQTYVVLSSGKELSVTNVQCFFKDQAEIDKVANLKKGDTCTIQGKVDGKSMNVGVNNCTIK